jgi:hypothetical protein
VKVAAHLEPTRLFDPGDRLLEDSKGSADMVPNAMGRRAPGGNHPATPFGLHGWSAHDIKI